MSKLQEIRQIMAEAENKVIDILIDEIKTNSSIDIEGLEIEEIPKTGAVFVSYYGDTIGLFSNPGAMGLCTEYLISVLEKEKKNKLYAASYPHW